MKKFFSIVRTTTLVLTVGLLVVSPLAALAQVGPPPAGTLPGTAPGNIPINIADPTHLFQTVQNILGWAFAFAVILGTAFIVAAGIIYITAGANSERVKTAVNMMIYAVIGIAITGFAWSIVNVAQSLIFTTPLRQ